VAESTVELAHATDPATIATTLSFTMKQDDEGRISNRGEGVGTVTEEMVRARASELAVINGRSKHKILDSDLKQARRELTGDERLNPPDTAEEEIPEDDRWGTSTNTGAQVPSMAASDEQTVAEKLVEEGVADAEHDQEIKATRESLRRERRS
jgi:hypothetical protein